jgi:hypothetical protein
MHVPPLAYISLLLKRMKRRKNPVLLSIRSRGSAARGPSFSHFHFYPSHSRRALKNDAPSASQFAAGNRRALLIAVLRRTLPRARLPHHPSPSSDPSPLPQATAPGPPPESPPMLRPHPPSVVAGRHCPPSDGPAATAPTYRRCPLTRAIVDAFHLTRVVGCRRRGISRVLSNRSALPGVVLPVIRMVRVGTTAISPPPSCKPRRSSLNR